MVFRDGVILKYVTEDDICTAWNYAMGCSGLLIYSILLTSKAQLQAGIFGAQDTNFSLSIG